jgi:osmotically-inducible protein OsmY
MNPGTLVRTDADILQDVLDELTRAPEVDASQIDVNVEHDIVPRNQIAVVAEDGIVTLEGRVKWGHERKAALDVARQFPGVREVICRIDVKQPDIALDDIKAAIERALIRSAELHAERIGVSIENGEVILSGSVRCPSEKEAAEAAAWRARGVDRVRNLIRVEPD